LCIIFGNTKNIANDIYKAMVEANYNVALIHKDLTNHERRKIFKEINSYTYQYVVATDLISRGVDLPYADLVISYGLPDDAL
jgi:ATP-dependent RNA helicase CshB